MERLQDTFGSNVSPAVIAEIVDGLEECDGSELLERATAALCNKLAPSDPVVSSEASSSNLQTAEGNL